MASGRYAKGLEHIMAGDITGGLDGADLKAVLVDAADYTVDLATHENITSIAAGARVATSGNLASKTVTNGVLDAANFTFSAVTGDPCEAVVIYWDSGSDATRYLLAYLELTAPVTPNGGDINLAFNTSGIFAL